MTLLFIYTFYVPRCVLKCFEQFKTRMHLQILCFLTPLPNNIETMEIKNCHHSTLKNQSQISYHLT
ncbi:exocyst complex component 2 [Aphis craccivora]|uniref:Exocyst complex component 2 n=1 Tax=Aphis craccivora TaxID=307492 RepID=A0A6G0YW62_APHCR|nr:exocyst complex component 2 [Aphis craccivora]